MTGWFTKSGLGVKVSSTRKRLSQVKTDALTNVLLWSGIIIGALLRFAWVGKREFWYDEVLSVLLSSGQRSGYKVPKNLPFKVQDISQLLDTANHSGLLTVIDSAKEVVKGVLGDPHPPLYYLGQHGWMLLFGNSEVALRSAGLLLSLVTLWVAYALGQKVLGHQGGLTLAALLSLNPFFLSHSLNLRMYAPMVFWVVVSGLCLLALFEKNRQEESTQARAGLRFGLAAALTAGLMTQYLFAYWLFAVVALVLYLDRKAWFSHALTVITSLVMFAPWVLWGVRQQANNRRDVLTQISSVGGPLQAALQHGKDIAQTLANHLLLGHLTTSMLPVSEPIKPTAVAIGCGVIGFLVMCSVGLYRRHQHRVLITCLIMGVLPLLVALGIDSAANKYTIGFGWGRSVMVALPGCLLLVSAWLTLATGRWQQPFTAFLLVAYLGVNVADFGGRDRQIFHSVSASIPNTSQPVLVAMNSRAWGHVLRLSYYLSDKQNTEVLATDPADMPVALKSALANKDYSEVLWLNAEYPLWGALEDPDEAQSLSAKTEALLKAAYPSQVTTGSPPTQELRGTMYLDRFALQVYGKNG